RRIALPESTALLQNPTSRFPDPRKLPLESFPRRNPLCHGRSLPIPPGMPESSAPSARSHGSQCQVEPWSYVLPPPLVLSRFFFHPYDSMVLSSCQHVFCEAHKKIGRVLLWTRPHVLALWYRCYDSFVKKRTGISIVSPVKGVTTRTIAASSSKLNP